MDTEITEKELSYIQNIAVFDGYALNIMDQILKKGKWSQHITYATNFGKQRQRNNC